MAEIVEVLRRVEDLLVGDVVAYSGETRTVERVRMGYELGDPKVVRVQVLFEGAPLVDVRPPVQLRKPEDTEPRMKPRWTTFEPGYRVLLLNSVYSARKEV